VNIFLNSIGNMARVAELVYAADLKSVAGNTACGFESHPGHQD
jgi:hypothetical protein